MYSVKNNIVLVDKLMAVILFVVIDIFNDFFVTFCKIFFW